MQESLSLKYETASEPLHIPVEWLFLIFFEQVALNLAHQCDQLAANLEHEKRRNDTLATRSVPVALLQYRVVCRLVSVLSTCAEFGRALSAGCKPV